MSLCVYSWCSTLTTTTTITTTTTTTTTTATTATYYYYYYYKYNYYYYYYYHYYHYYYYYYYYYFHYYYYYYFHYYYYYYYYFHSYSYYFHSYSYSYSYSYYYYHTGAGTVAKNMTSSGRRKKHGLPTEKSTGRGTAPTVAKNLGYRRKKHHRRRKHTLPMQKTWPAVAKNMPSHQDRRKKHPPPLQKTPPTATVAKNTKTSHRRKKHELPTQKTRNPFRPNGKAVRVSGFFVQEIRVLKFREIEVDDNLPKQNMYVCIVYIRYIDVVLYGCLLYRIVYSLAWSPPITSFAAFPSPVKDGGPQPSQTFPMGGKQQSRCWHWHDTSPPRWAGKQNLGRLSNEDD